jgi:hypothetical protein
LCEHHRFARSQIRGYHRKGDTEVRQVSMIRASGAPLA